MSKYVQNLIAQGADPVLIAKLGGHPRADAAPVDDTATDSPAPRKISKPRKRTAKR